MNRFNLVLIAALLLIIVGMAQPRELPVSWGPFRMLSEGMPNGSYPKSVAAKGDTIVLVKLDMIAHLQYTSVRVSGDNGRTWSPWQYLNDTTIHHFSEYPAPIITNNNIMVMNTNAELPERYGFFRTTDLGQSWIRPRTTYHAGYYMDGTSGDTIIMSNPNPTILSDSVTWVTSNSLVLQPRKNLFFDVPNVNSQFLSYGSYCANRQWMFGVCGFCDLGPYSATLLAFRRISYNGQIVGPLHMLMNHITYHFYEGIDFDDDGNGVIFVASDTMGPIIDYFAITRIVTHDYGESWSIPVTMTPVLSAGRWNYVSHYGHYWAICWQDSSHAPDLDPLYNSMVKISFSPNRGHYWYPPVEAPLGDTSLLYRRNLAITMGPNYVRVFGFCPPAGGYRFYEKEMIFNRDARAPVLSNGTIIPLSVSTDTTLNLALTAVDNDSIWNAILVVKRIGSRDSLMDTLRYDSLNRYTTHFTVPTDSGEYAYYYFAEDLWENRGYYPDSARTNPPHFRVGGVNVVKESELLPQQPLLCAFPNPVNGMITFTGQLPARSSTTQLQIYNLTGALVASLPIKPNTSGSYRAMWNCRNRSGTTIASGVYYATFGSTAAHQTLKFVVMR